MRSGHREAIERHGGFSVTETLLVLAITGILAALAIPLFARYHQAAKLTLAAQELMTLLNTGRQLAITQNAPICVHTSSTAVHYRQGGCAGPVWLGPGTDGSGNIALPAGISLSATADPLFSYLGAASPAATYTVTSSETGATLRITVAASGRIAVSP
jgi:prepilin-type N-terminal cleavage/methylation domain-containing protein